VLKILTKLWWVVQRAYASFDYISNRSLCHFGYSLGDSFKLDYTEESVLKCFDSTTEKLDVFTGTAEIRGFFDGLFKQLSDLSTLAAPVVDATEGPMKQVYLIWSCPGSGVKFAHDSFYYNDKFQITRQNIGYTSC
jgi:hypothetical protein